MESRRGCARTVIRGEVIEVLVGERTGQSDNVFGSCAAFVQVACVADGRAMVTTRQAPPAIIVSSSGPRVTPADAGLASVESLRPGERLLVLSSASFDEMPEVLVDLLYTTPDRLLLSYPVDLLVEIVAATGQGAGALIERLTVNDPTGRTR